MSARIMSARIMSARVRTATRRSGETQDQGPASPLPQRDGIDPVRVRLPEDPDGAWATVRDHLVERYGAAVGAGRVEEMLREGRFVGTDGPVGGDEPYAVGRWIWFHRDFPPETPVPFAVGVVYRDERIVVADKPHFLATMPRGRHVTETATARLRRDLGLPASSPRTGSTG